MPEKSLKRSINFSPETLKALDTLAAKNSTTTSELVRQYVEKGLSIEGYSQDIDFIARIVRQELMAVYHLEDIKAVVEQQTNRIAKMHMYEMLQRRVAACKRMEAKAIEMMQEIKRDGSLRLTDYFGECAPPVASDKNNPEQLNRVRNGIYLVHSEGEDYFAVHEQNRFQSTGHRWQAERQGYLRLPPFYAGKAAHCRCPVQPVRGRLRGYRPQNLDFCCGWCVAACRALYAL